MVQKTINCKHAIVPIERDVCFQIEYDIAIHDQDSVNAWLQLNSSAANWTFDSRKKHQMIHACARK